MNDSFLVGTRCYLRSWVRQDLSVIVGWTNDREVVRTMFRGDRPAQLELLSEAWAEEIRDPRIAVFAVCTHDHDRFVGTAGLYGIHPIARSAEFRIFLGDKSVWNTGIGTECTRMVTSYGFDTLNLNRVWLGVNMANPAAVRAYEKAGFVREGVLRQESYRNGRYDDVLRMSVLRSEAVEAGLLTAPEPPSSSGEAATPAASHSGDEAKRTGKEGRDG